MAARGTLTAVAETGVEALPRSPSPSKPAGCARPSVRDGTSHMVMLSDARGRLVHPYLSAWPAEVTRLLRASSRTWPSLRVAVPSGAQKWLREPDSENAS